jgi:hypothetical protein
MLKQRTFNVMKHLKMGDSIAETVHLEKYFEINRPGRYSISVRRVFEMAGKRSIVVSSNKISIFLIKEN